jgi:anti-anti-sigma regulatory factor
VRRVEVLRITRIDIGRGVTALRLEGRVTELELEMLHETSAECLRENRRLVLDLSGVLFVSLEGAAAIRHLQERGIVLEGCSPFVRELLNEGSQ